VSEHSELLAGREKANVCKRENAEKVSLSRVVNPLIPLA